MKSRRTRVFADDARRFVDPAPPVWIKPPCAWRGCTRRRWDDLPVCQMHAVMVSKRVRESITPVGCAEPEPDVLQGYVYYLMLSPTRVKIGTTTRLTGRMRDFRTELQYVVAIERGGKPEESQRHKQFADERYGRLEDFQLSDRLKAHIESLQPDRDEILNEATALFGHSA